jgi:hypothetical protein
VVLFIEKRNVAMQDMKAHLEKLLVQISECELIRDLATDPVKRDLFGKLAEQYRHLANDIEIVLAKQFRLNEHGTNGS